MRKKGRQVQGNPGWLPLVLVFFLVGGAAVYSGYLGTKYMIAPFFLEGKAGEIKAESGEEREREPVLESPSGEGQTVQKEPVSREEEKGETSLEKITLYTLKFGTYSTEENGNRAVEALAEKSIYSYPVGVEGEFRIYSLPFIEKADATAFKEGYLALGEDCFVVPRDFSLKPGFSSDFMKDYVDVLREISLGTYTGPQRQQMAVSLLAELKTTYGSVSEATASLITKTAEEAALITGTDNQMLFELQKTIIMNMALALS